MNHIDINCDMGESYGNYIIGNDEEIMPYISSCNVACGFHGGDPLHIEKTLRNALKYNLRIGAHPGFPDLNGFGRRNMHLSEDELSACIKYQISAIIGMAKSIGASVRYVKPHGALYNILADDEQQALVVINAVKEVDASLAIMGLAGSRIKNLVESAKMTFIAEAFADRTYNVNGRLLSRLLAGSVIYEPAKAVEQVISIVKERRVKTVDGSFVPLEAESICIHGDNKNAVSILKAIKNVLNYNNSPINEF